MPAQTPEEMEAQADELEAQARQLRGWAAAIREIQRQASATRGLPSAKDNAYNAEMSQAQIANSPVRPRGAPLKSDGPVARVAKILGVSGADVAWLLNVNYQTSRAWDADGRRVPDDIAPRLDGLVASKKAVAESLKRLADRPKSQKFPKKPAK